jgi:secondary thiamine-phosphate synthase enzyme
MENMTEHIIKTASSDEMINITPLVRQDVQKAGITSGAAVVLCPHTTAGVTINENADPDVVYDLLSIFSRECTRKAEATGIWRGTLMPMRRHPW